MNSNFWTPEREEKANQEQHRNRRFHTQRIMIARSLRYRAMAELSKQQSALLEEMNLQELPPKLIERAKREMMKRNVMEVMAKEQTA